MICKNCGQSFEGNFCNNCGQSSSVSQINFKYIIHEIPNSVLQFNRGLLFTIKELSLRPGHSIREFISGKRKAHYKPIAFFIIASAVYALVTHLFEKNTYFTDLVSGFVTGLRDKNQDAGLEIVNWITENQTYIALLFIPFFSLASYLAFKKYTYNYFEHLVLNLYVSGQQMFVYLILSFVITKDNFLQILPFTISLIYNFWAFSQFFAEKRMMVYIIRLLATYIIYVFELILIIIISVGVGKLIS